MEMEPIFVGPWLLLMRGNDELFYVLATKRAVISPSITPKIPGLRCPEIRHKDMFEAVLGRRFSRLIVNLTQTHQQRRSRVKSRQHTSAMVWPLSRILPFFKSNIAISMACELSYIQNHARFAWNALSIEDVTKQPRSTQRLRIYRME